MESWLPFYPQLGAKLVYEQYYGDEVALFGTDNLQKDPHAVTLGLEYTPVPLVTVGTDYKAGTGDSNDFSVNCDRELPDRHAAGGATRSGKR